MKGLVAFLFSQCPIYSGIFRGFKFCTSPLHSLLVKYISNNIVLFYEKKEEFDRRLEVLSPVKRTPRQASVDMTDSDSDVEGEVQKRRKRIKTKVLFIVLA